MKKTVFFMPLLAVASLCAVAGTSIAATPVTMQPESVIGARQAAYAFMAGNFGEMKAAIAAGKSPKDFADTAQDMAEWAALIPAMFPPGTETGNDTKAKPAVFSDPKGFAHAAGVFEVAAKDLAAAAKADDKIAFAAAFKTTAKACGACHKSYREKD